MAVTVKRSNITEISGAGTIVEINESSFKIEDKNGILDFDFALLNEFLNKEVTFKFRTKEDTE
jgi:hypothetical protein